MFGLLSAFHGVLFCRGFDLQHLGCSPHLRCLLALSHHQLRLSLRRRGSEVFLGGIGGTVVLCLSSEESERGRGEKERSEGGRGESEYLSYSNLLVMLHVFLYMSIGTSWKRPFFLPVC